MTIIETSNLTKKYGTLKAVDKVSLQVPKGKIYGFLGLNGAGKTTTMRMLLGMIKPSSGSASLFGKIIPDSSLVWRKVGYMVESTYAYPNLTVKENLELFYHYYGLSGRSAISQIISKLSLDRYQNIKARHLSLGNLQRLGLAKALIHQPELLILDEPVNGLDPSGIVEIRHLLKSLSQTGTTILISSHLLSEVAKIADTIGIIHQGALLKEIESSELRQQIQHNLIIDTNDNQKAKELLDNHGIEASKNSEGELKINNTDRTLAPASIADIIIGNQLQLNKLFTHEEDLESYFMRTIQQEKS